MKHEHEKECKHPSVHYCQKCNVIYCDGCEMEWVAKIAYYYTWGSSNGTAVPLNVTVNSESHTGH